MKILITATIQMKMHVRNGCSANEAIKAGRQDIEDSLEHLSGYLVKITEVQAENLDSEDGTFNVQT